MNKKIRIPHYTELSTYKIVNEQCRYKVIYLLMQLFYVWYLHMKLYTY